MFVYYLEIIKWFPCYYGSHKCQLYWDKITDNKLMTYESMIENNPTDPVKWHTKEQKHLLILIDKETFKNVAFPSFCQQLQQKYLSLR